MNWTYCYSDSCVGDCFCIGLNVVLLGDCVFGFGLVIAGFLFSFVLSYFFLIGG